MATRKSQQVCLPPNMPPERAYAALKKQLDLLQMFRTKNYADAQHEEQEWTQLTRNIVERAFGNPSSNLAEFYGAKSAGDYYMIPYGGMADPHHDQRNFLARMNSLEAFLKSTLAELELIMPEKEIQGHYDVGDQYQFYRDVKAILTSATSDVFIVDPYLSTEIFDIYADGISPSVPLRILTNNPPPNLLAVANKYASGAHLQLRTSTTIHDRLILIDQRVWFIGQSIKDAAKRKPTYIVEQDGSLVGPIYENIWRSGTVLI